VTDHEVCFEGYLSNFNGDGDGEPDLLGVPHFVVHRVDRAKVAVESGARPRPWFTVDELADQGVAPTDASYVFSQKWHQLHADWYERGHLAQKYLLERISADAAWYSHNIANAVPQRGRFNKMAWLDLECRTGAWANRGKPIWVIAGYFSSGAPTAWLRGPRRPAMPIAITDALFKIIVRQTEIDTRHSRSKCPNNTTPTKRRAAGTCSTGQRPLSG
jgi:DNA/RNA endonuclease G (NUC1)